MLKAIQVRLYPTPEQELALAKSFGCARWYWNYALNACIQHYKETGKSLKLASYKGMLPQLKKEYPWLKEDCYSSVLQCVAINLDRAYKNFFEVRAKFPRFKSKHHQQSIQYPQNVTVNSDYLKVPKIGEIKAVFHREVTGKIKTVTISKTATNKYFASILYEVEGTDIKQSGDKIIGIDLGLKDFAIVHDGDNATKYANPKHLYRHQKNLARKQNKLSRKTKGSSARERFKKIVAKVHERIANSRQDFLHKLSRKLVDESQVIVIENLNVKGMVKNRKLSKSISDVGWGMFVNFIDYKLKQKEGELIEIGRFFPSSKTCSSCGHVLDELSLNIREWDCPNCHTHHDRDSNAALNIRNEGIRIKIEGGGNPVSADGACIRPDNRKVKGRRAKKSEANTYS
ncbi:RNA-guided endonuclease InsQ/TnpB family protein [Planktothrix mougeotii]|uniref:Transposase n=1 Tax=Planktothrix mougeotii LEGE 06226 TaxID=1828728 RepID=A0ABR9UG63_9CYAN|nr:RNA-guided endonuclease TnpB family protein [Planktothrix mougeotii]MBE9144554.1 transposase [Planktothrix mougeotii LEGE 06226]